MTEVPTEDSEDSEVFRRFRRPSAILDGSVRVASTATPPECSQNGNTGYGLWLIACCLPWVLV
jgi:hypothetical protein